MVATLDNPTAKHRTAGEFPQEQFVTLENIPVFAEHETVAKDGRKLKFGRPELEAVAQRCNRRIEDSGDYAAITIGHTPDPRAVQTGQAKMPEVIGFAGPFRIGVIGEGNKSRYAILANMHVYKDDFEKVKKHPRRSPELWVEDRYDEMFLDPIALLGAEAPRLDMGLLYAAQKNGKVVHKYTAAGPGPGNVFIPSHDYGGQCPRDYAAQPSDDISPSKAREILGHGEVHGHPLTDKQEGMFGAAAGKLKNAASAAQPTGATGMISPDDVRQIVDALEQLDWVQFVKAQMQSQSPAGGAAPASPPASPEATAPPAAPPSPEPAGTPPGAPPPKEEPEKDMSGIKPYAADVPTGSVDGTVKKPAEGDVDPTSGDPDASTYQEAGGKGEVKKMSRRLEMLEKQLADERGKRIDSERKAQLMELAGEGFTVDIEKESKRCCYSKMSDEVFAEHVESIRENYQRVPFNVTLPTGGAFTGRMPAVEAAVNGTGPHKYSKAHHDRAYEICEREALDGKKPEYMEVLEKVATGKI